MQCTALPRDFLVPDAVGEAEVSFRRDDGREVCRPWAAVSVDALGAAIPWRQFRWYKGQKHYSGLYWAATTQGHVLYESRLELGRLLFADFDAAVSGIVAQPFFFSVVVDGRPRKHVPDYLLLAKDGPVVVDVKPLSRLEDPRVAFTLGWTRQVVESRGWRYEVACEPPAARLGNVMFLSGYRRGWLFDRALVERLRGADLNGLTLAEASRRVTGYAPETVRSALLHLLWRQVYAVDLSRPLSPHHVIGDLS